MDFDQVLRKNRKKLIAEPGNLPVRFSYGKEDIQKIIPHRDPFLLVDKLTGFDPENNIICGSTYIDPELPLFKGHFPDFPVYPGALQLEMSGQLGLCMNYFITNNVTEITGTPEITPIRATRVVGAYYLQPVLPNTTVQIIAQLLESDGYFAKVIGQIITEDGNVASVSISEVCFL
ncbi:MAG: beta-hydroxyacyl-ACP dehydratase [Spirochaetaceae bacterium]|jgi:3-hydroxyacyl-[acyl-carrier-protein] dehydratase|nr:beta-hydroxyacyl-ACP dehydratase [Spirochaetaceae bacterium]